MLLRRGKTITLLVHVHVDAFDEFALLDMITRIYGI
jgi:hypothetical protein